MDPEADSKSTTFDTRWIARWLTKWMTDRRIKNAALGRMVGVRGQRITQIRSGDDPGLELFWRLCAVHLGEEGFERIPDETIRGIIFRLITQLGPNRLIQLAEMSSQEAQAMLSDHEHRSAQRERVTPLIETGIPDPEMS